MPLENVNISWDDSLLHIITKIVWGGGEVTPNDMQAVNEIFATQILQPQKEL